MSKCYYNDTRIRGAEKMNIFSRLDNLTDLTTNEQTLVDYMKNNPERFINMSADEISAACFISIPTIYRLCKKPRA